MPFADADVDLGTNLETLLCAVGEGDTAAFECLYLATRARLLGLIYNTVRDAGYAEEVLQEAYVEVWQKAHLYQPAMGKPLSWLMMICHRRAIDRVRTEEREKRRTETSPYLRQRSLMPVAPMNPSSCVRSICNYAGT